MATQAKDDSTNYYLGLVLFSVLIPVLFFVSVWLSPTGASTREHEAAAAAPAAEAPAAAEAPPAPAE